GYGISGYTAGIQLTRGAAANTTRWMGGYQSNSLALAAFYAQPEFWVIGTCVQDSGTHPNLHSLGGDTPLSTYGASIVSEIPYLTAARYFLEETVHSGLPCNANWTINGQTFTLDQW